MTDIFPSNVIEITRELIRCPSVTPAEAGALSYLESILSQAGFKVSRPVFADQDTPDVENLFASFGSGSPHFVFAGHTDVVPVGSIESWSHDPFAGTTTDGVLIGRGAVDMKGGIGAFVAAALEFLSSRATDFNGTLSFLITGDEEGPAVNGTKKLLQWCEEQGEKFHACIVGEPTNPAQIGDTIKVGRRGSLSGVLTVTGKQGHVAYPHLAVNPVPQLISLLNTFNQLELDAGNERFQPSNLEVTSIDIGNSASNVIPERAVARFNIRFNDQWSQAALAEHLKESLSASVQQSGADWVLSFAAGSSDSFLTRDEALIGTLSGAIEAEINRKPELSTGGGTSDARFIKNYCPVVEFGLISQTMHQIDEQIATADLETLCRIYYRFLVDYFEH
ncbi:MAG: succinyl-diaminopimelate desuccinylase [Stappiaceae bacterium]